MEYIYFLIAIYSINSEAFAQEITPANGTSGLEVGYHQVIEKAKLCAGIDLNFPSAFKKSAFVYSFDETVVYNPTINVKAYLVKGRTEINKLLNYDSKIAVSIPFIGGADGKIQAGVNTNNIDEEVSLVFVATSIYNPEIPNDNKIAMTPEAEALITEPLKFKKKYGLYFYNAIFKGHRLVCSVNLKKSYASTYYNLFASGKASIALDKLGIEAQSSIRGEIKKSVDNNSSMLTIDAYGGPDIKEYQGALTSLVKGDGTMDNISIYLETLLGKFEYKNAKPLMAYLSDYSAWGIQESPLLNDAVFETQKALQKLYPKVTAEINTLKILSSEKKLKTEFSAEQLTIARANVEKLIRLRTRIEETHQQLNYGDTTMIGKDVGFFEEYYNIVKDNPEIYEFLMGYKNSVPLSFVLDGNQIQNLDNIKNIVKQICFYNTFNSKSAFSNLKTIMVVNTETNTTIEKVDLEGSSSGSLSVAEFDVQVVYLSTLIGSARLDTFIMNIEKDIRFFYQRVVSEAIQNPTNYAKYEIFLTDNFDRVYKFPFLDANISFVPPNGFNISLKQLGTNEICNYLPDFIANDQDTMKLPQSIFIDLSHIDYRNAKNLVLKIRTNNNLINSKLEDSTYWDFNLKIADIKLTSNLHINLSDYPFKSFDKLNFSWYTINNQEVNSEVKLKELSLHKTLCNSSIKLF